MDKCYLKINTELVVNNIQTKDIKNAIIDYITKTETKNLKNNQDFIKRLIESFACETLLNFIELNLLAKEIIFLRHGLAEHNYYNKNKELFEKKPEFFDPDLVEDGVNKLKIIKKEMLDKNFKYDLVLVSPLRRTLNTLTILKEKDFDLEEKVKRTENEETQKVFNSVIESNDIQQSLEAEFIEEVKSFELSEFNKSLFHLETKFYVCDLIREKLQNRNTHVGLPLNELKDIYKSNSDLDFKFSNKNYWWVDFDDENYNIDYGLESWENFNSRLYIFLIFLCAMEQKSILIVSHSKIGKFLLGKQEKQKVSQEIIHYVDKELVLNSIKDFIQNLK